MSEPDAILLAALIRKRTQVYYLDMLNITTKV